MSTETNPRGRPRAFDTDEILQQSVEVFWRHGFSGTTTRTLEQELGISQSSLYNAFGSKEKLFEQTVSRYEEQLEAEVMSHLAGDDPDRDSLLAFVDAVTIWIRNDDHRGCLVLNLGLDTEDGGRRVTAYRAKLRELLSKAIGSFTYAEADIEARTELIVAAILGLNISASSGASKAELLRLRDGIKHQIRAW
ncbi:MAG: TetR/AcrR family transcriptional regulator [Acidimicrobiia bacterium]|nr:TetR/AcrR family transcriptional regulator [Acidimicrobiia bacterium]